MVRNIESPILPNDDHFQQQITYTPYCQMSQMDEISVEIDDNIDKDKIDIDKVNIANNIEKDKLIDDDKSHNGNIITMIEISPNGKYLVTYSEEDHSIVGWNIEDVDEGQLKLDHTVEPVKLRKREIEVDLHKMCVSDDKKLACITFITYEYEYGSKKQILEIYNMNNHQNIELDCHLGYDYYYFTFNLKGELILYGDCCEKKIIYFYSTQIKNNTWKCKKIYEIPKDFKLISISKCNKLYLFSNNSIYEWDLITKKEIKIFIDEKIEYDDHNKDESKQRRYIKENITVFSNEKFICTRIKDKIIIYSIELEIPIDSLDINNVNQMCKPMKLPVLCPLLFPLFSNIPSSGFWDSIMENCREKCLDHLKQYDQLPKKYFNLPNSIRAASKYAYGILDGNVFKIDLEKLISNVNSLLKNSDELNNSESNDIVGYWYFDNDFKINKKTYETYETLNVHLLSSYIMDTVHALFQEVIPDSGHKERIIWSYNNDDYNDKIELQVFRDLICTKLKNNQSFMCTEVENFEPLFICTKVKNLEPLLIKAKLINSNIITLTDMGLFIYHFNENDKSISLNYYYYMDFISIDQYGDRYYYYNKLQSYKKLFSKLALPLPNYNSFKFCDEWVSYVKDEKGEKRVFKYDTELLIFAIKEHNLELVDVIYKKCDKESLLKYGVELLTFAIENHQPKLIDDIYKKCINYFKEDLGNNRIFLSIITSNMPLLNEYYPEYTLKYSLETIMIIDSLFHNKEHRNNDLHLYSFQYLQIVDLTRSIWWLKYNALMRKLKNNYKLTFKILSFIQELIILILFPIWFVTCRILLRFHFIFKIDSYDNIFDTYVNGYLDTLFLFQKKTTPSIITITFMNPYIKFINYPQNYNWVWELLNPQSNPFAKTISSDIYKTYKTWSGEALINFKWNNYGKYYYAIIWIGFIILLGCFNAVATIPQEYINEGIQKQLLVASIILGSIHLSFEIRQFIYNPIKWIRDAWNIFDIKFLLFFRAFESFGVYFTIIISVAKKIASFVVVLLIIIIGFAHAFYILLSPETKISFETYTNTSINDLNNPWNLVPTYIQVYEDGTTNSNSFIIQKPDGNTNMFTNFKMALFAVYLFLTGDSRALSNWTYNDNSTLAILVVLFSLLIVVYLMNLFIGLLNIAIEKDKVSYLIQKAEIIAEIELFYLLPHQRRWYAWFPEVIHYYASVDKTREKIKEMISKGEWKTEFPELKQNLLNELAIQSVDENSLQQLLKEIQSKL
ncbi:hypothetical protein C1646_743692 [Rhizophagus diaphanus]|nr:hypothetical protein C1646_743692 [Rhizophagus diaphanus] [Rhizophagus sp. MUCL 43196]